MALNQGMAE